MAPLASAISAMRCQSQAMSRGAQHAQGEDETGDIAAQERFVEDLFAADGLDGEDVAAGLGAIGEGATHRLPEGAVAQLGRPPLVAQVHDGGAQSAGQAGGFMRLLQELAEDGGDFGPPRGRLVMGGKCSNSRTMPGT